MHPARTQWYVRTLLYIRSVILSWADFEDQFNWNVKQLFVYVVADYRTQDGVRVAAFFFVYLGMAAFLGNWLSLACTPLVFL